MEYICELIILNGVSLKTEKDRRQPPPPPREQGTLTRFDNTNPIKIV